MEPEEIQDIFRKIKKDRPLIHMIPNTVSAALCADGLAALGARPLMAVEPLEMEEITSQADGIVVNLGQLTREKKEACLLALQSAGREGKPVVLDPVGCGASRFRLEAVQELSAVSWKGIIKGNQSEIYSIQQNCLTREGIDAISTRTLQARAEHGRTFLVTGEADQLIQGETSIFLRKKNSRPFNIVGTGCLLGAAAGACHSVEAAREKAAEAASFGLAYALEQAGNVSESGGLAYALEHTGNGTGYGQGKQRLLDALGMLTESGFIKWMKEAERSVL